MLLLLSLIVYLRNNNYKFDTWKTKEVAGVDCKITLLLIINDDSFALLSMPFLSLFTHSLPLSLLLMWIRSSISRRPFKGWEMGPHFPTPVFMGHLLFFLAQNFTTTIVQLLATKKSKKINGVKLKLVHGSRFR